MAKPTFHPFEVDVARVVAHYGSQYRSVGDALKEYVSNSIDEWRKSVERMERCEVSFTIRRDRIVFEDNIPGISKENWERVAKSITRSVKKGDVETIGEHGVGIWAGFYFARKLTFFSRAKNEGETNAVTVRKGEYGITHKPALKRESRWKPSMQIVMENFDNPEKVWRSATIHNLSRVFEKKFRKLITSGLLQITIHRGKEKSVVTVEPIELPPLKSVPKSVAIGGDRAKTLVFDMHFAPGGNGIVSIDHRDIPIIDDIRELEKHEEEEFGIASSILGSGYVHGSIEADFLIPSEDRQRFMYYDPSWAFFVAELSRLMAGISSEVESSLKRVEAKRRPDLYSKAVTKAQKILESLELDPLTGFKKRKKSGDGGSGTGGGGSGGTGGGGSGGPNGKGKGGKKDKPTGPTEEEKRKSPNHLLIQEMPLGNSDLHSELVEGVVHINTDHIDYMWAMMQEDEAEHVRYIGMCVGKETILSAELDEWERLEMFLAFQYGWEHS